VSVREITGRWEVRRWGRKRRGRLDRDEKIIQRLRILWRGIGDVISIRAAADRPGRAPSYLSPSLAGGPRRHRDAASLLLPSETERDGGPQRCQTSVTFTGDCRLSIARRRHRRRRLPSGSYAVVCDASGALLPSGGFVSDSRSFQLILFCFTKWN